MIVDPQKALAHRLVCLILPTGSKASNNVASVGRLDANYQQFLVLTNSQFKRSGRYRRTPSSSSDPASPVRLKDVRIGSRRNRRSQTLVTGNGKPAAIVNVTRQIGGNIISVSQQVKDIAFHGKI